MKLIAKSSCGWKWVQETNSLRYRYTTIQCASSPLPLSFTTVAFQMEGTQLWIFYLAHNSCFCVLYCTSKDWCILQLLLEASEVLFQELLCMFWTSFPTVPSSSEVNLTFRAVGGFQFQCNFWHNEVLHPEFSTRYCLVIFCMFYDFRIVSEMFTVLGHIVMFIITIFLAISEN